MLFHEEDEDLVLFQDRAEAGRVLGAKLASYIGQPGVLVLALPRGGVVVGFEVAKVLHAPLDVFVVRKLGVPGNPELAMGAIASGGVRVLNAEIVETLRISEHEIEEAVAREETELGRREQLYRGGLPGCNVGGKKVVLVDDGVATGATIRAGIAALRLLKAAHITAAVPVTPLSVYYELQEQADDVTCINAPEGFWAISQCYEVFEQVSDDEVVTLLRRAAMLAKTA